MDEDELVIDSPDLSPVEDEELEDLEDNLKLSPAETSAPKTATKDRDGNREQVCHVPRGCSVQPTLRLCLFR